MTTILQSSTRTARKKHVCEWCGQAILPGTRYDYETSIFDGDFTVLKAHRSCNALATELWREGDYGSDEGLDMDGFAEEVTMRYNEGNPDPAIVSTREERLEWVKKQYGLYDLAEQPKECIFITAGRAIENQGDLALDIGIAGDECFLFGSRCDGAVRGEGSELFRIRVDKARLAEWGEYIDRLQCHIKE